METKNITYAKKEGKRALYFFIGILLSVLAVFLWKTSLGLTDPTLTAFLLQSEELGGYVSLGGMLISFAAVYLLCRGLGLIKKEAFGSFRKRMRKGIW
jgi:hypothetical protein